MTQLVVMAGGHGTRFQSICTHSNKCFLPVNGKPIVQHIIESTVDDVIIGTWEKYRGQFNNYTSCFKATIVETISSSSIETSYNLRDYIKNDFFLSVADGYSKKKLTKPSHNTFYTKFVKDSKSYNTVKIAANKILEIKHFEDTGWNQGLVGLFYIKDKDIWFDICRDVIKRGLKDREANNSVFSKFIEICYTQNQNIDWEEFNSLEDYLKYAKT